MKKAILIIVLGLLWCNISFAETIFLECPEKVIKIRQQNDGNYLEEGQEIGTNYVKFDESKSKVTIHFKFESSNEAPFVLFRYQKAIKNEIGFSIDHESSGGGMDTKDSFDFVKLLGWKVWLPRLRQ